jgi:DNA-binding LacI/PurR family transcriptional regulator
MDGRRPTLEDVAAHAGVSRALVSIVIRGTAGASEATRERVLASAAALDYRPDPRAQLLARRRTRLIGTSFGAHYPFHADILEGIYLAAEPAGYDIALSAHTPSRDEHRAVESLLDYRCEALILVGPQVSESRLAELSGRLPVVVVGRHVRDRSVHVVRTDDEAGVRAAVAHLIELGHRDIVHVDGGRAPGAAERRRGYRAAMRSHGLDERVRIVRGGLTEEHGAAAAQTLMAGGEVHAAATRTATRTAKTRLVGGELRAVATRSTDTGPAGVELRAAGTRPTKAAVARDEPLPTAVVAFNDRCAVGVMDTLARAGVRVPEDVSIVGFDDDRLSRLPHVNLTTVAQNASRIAAQAVNTAVALLDGGAEAEREVVIPPQLTVRGTTGPPVAAPSRKEWRRWPS